MIFGLSGVGGLGERCYRARSGLRRADGPGTSEIGRISATATTPRSHVSSRVTGSRWPVGPARKVGDLTSSATVGVGVCKETGEVSRRAGCSTPPPRLGRIGGAGGHVGAPLGLAPTTPLSKVRPGAITVRKLDGRVISRT